MSQYHSGWVYKLNSKKKWQYRFAALDNKNKILYWHKNEFDKDKWGNKISSLSLENCKILQIVEQNSYELPVEPPPNSEEAQFYIEDDKGRKTFFSAKDSRAAKMWINVITLISKRRSSRAGSFTSVTPKVDTLAQACSALIRAAEKSREDVIKTGPTIQKMAVQTIKS